MAFGSSIWICIQNIGRTLNAQLKQPNCFKWAEDMKRYLIREDTRMGNKHMRRRSASPVIIKLQIKTTARQRYGPVGLSRVKQRCASSHEDKGQNTDVLLRGVQNGSTHLPRPQTYHSTVFTQEKGDCMSLQRQIITFIAASCVIIATWRHARHLSPASAPFLCHHPHK